MNLLDLSKHRAHLMTALVVAVTGAAAGCTWLLVTLERTHDMAPRNLAALTIFGVLLFLAETRPSFSMKFGDHGSISPGWTFAYALMLFGMPLEALAILVIATGVESVTERKALQIAVFNPSVLAASLSAGALVLHAFGLHGPITSQGRIPVAWGVAIVLGAATMLLLNGLIIAIAIGLHTGASLGTTLRTGLAVSMTADGALLSLAPVFVIAIDFSLALVPLLASTSYIVIQSARKSLQRAHEANHDPLTGLLNRRAFHDRLCRALGMSENERDAIVLVMDFDRFKEINDALGHASGDTLLVRFAERLVEALPSTASAARLGGDEFAVLITLDASSDEALSEVTILHAALTDSYDIDGFPLSMSVSIGMACAPEHGVVAEDLIAAADLAMYRAKQSGRGVEMYQPASDTSTRRTSGVGRIGLLSGLADAIDRGQLTNAYQPQVDCATGRVHTVEALVRWNHPIHGLVMPNDFIDMAEQTDLIDALTEDVLRRAMRDVLSLSNSAVNLSVNVSARSLHQRTFANSVRQAAGDAGFPTDRLELEITERAIATDPERVQLTIARLREAGIRIAIDDFGTGYSSFASLRQTAADRLKIDQSFTRQLATSREDRLVVETIVNLAHGLGLDVVGEGVESRETWDRVRELGCDYAQGFGIARPMTIFSLRAFVAKPISVDAQLELCS